MNKPKLLYIITQGGPWGGAQKYVFDLATNISDTYDVTVAVGEAGGEKDLQKKLSMNNKQRTTNNNVTPINIVQLKHLKRNIFPIQEILAIFELKKLYKELQPDIIHLNSSKAGILGSIAKAISYKLKAISCYTVHGWVFDEPMGKLRRWFYRSLEKFSSRFRDKIIVLSEDDKKTGLTIGIPVEKLQIVPNALSNTIFETRQTSKNALEKICSATFSTYTYLIGTIANFYPTKGLDLLLQAFAATKNQMPNARVLIIGDGPERKNLEKLRIELNLENTVHFAGFVPEAAKYLAAFDLFILPSTKEGSPFALLEAAAAGVPIVATQTGDTAARFSGAAKIIPTKNISELTNALVFAFTHKEEMKTMSNIARARVNENSFQVTIEKTTSLYSLLPAEVKSH